jgi:hypothetical protein
MLKITSTTAQRPAKLSTGEFCRLGGRPKEFVIDQDAVFVSSETYGEVIKY